MTANRTVDWCTKMTTKSSLFKLFMCFTCELLVPACSHDSCYRYSYEEVLVSRDTCRVSDKNRLKHLATSMKFWKSSSQVLSKTFPLDPQKKNFVREVRNVVFSVTKPTALKTKVRLATFSRMALEEILDMDSQQITRDTEFLQIVSGNKLLPGSTPLCHRYGGHQFGVWADQLGDGRAHMLGEYVNVVGERWELQLKGSGLTPYSRRGDGRAVIRSSVREFLASEAMYHLGVPTSRAATLVTSNDPVIRDQFYNGNMRREKAAVVLRLAKSWFRFGSFEILTVNREIKLLRQLANFVIESYFPQVDMQDDNCYLIWFEEIVDSTAQLIALWQSVGFAHGVCNTDNFSILGDTIDYGPFRFMDEYESDMVPNTSDDERRYSYQNQPDVGAFNLDKLRLAMEPLLTRKQRKQMLLIFNGYPDVFKRKYVALFRKKLGIEHPSTNDVYLIGTLLTMMEDNKADFTLTFRQLSDWNLGDIEKHRVPNKLWALKKISHHPKFREWTRHYAGAIGDVDLAVRKLRMDAQNPRYVLRNWIAQEIILKVEQNDFNLLHTVQKVLQKPFVEQEEAERLGFADPPPDWAKNIKVSCSS